MNRKGNSLITASRLRLGIILMVSLLVAQTVLHAGNPFSRIFVLGDSLSDTGNFFRDSGGIPPAPYAGGRFSNGPLWIEYFAQGLGMEILSGDNFAVGGATTGVLNSNNGVNDRDYSGLQQQVTQLLASANGQLDSDALYVLWAGANDFFIALETGATPAQLIGGGVGNTAAAVQQLWIAGARHILVPNVPDLGLTPFALQSGLAPVITQLSAAYNQVLAGTLQSLGQAGISIIQVDAFSTLQAMVSDPAQFGFVNVTAPFLSVGGDPAQFLFWDQVHPTTVGHEVLAQEALESLLDHYSPNNGQATPPARYNSLNGLVVRSVNP